MHDEHDKDIHILFILPDLVYLVDFQTSVRRLKSAREKTVMNRRTPEGCNRFLLQR